MQDCYDPIAPERGLRASFEEYNALKAALEADDYGYTGFEVEYGDGLLYVFAPESGFWESFPQTFLALLGSLIAKNSLEYLAFGPACEGDIPRMGVESEVDTFFGVGRDGSLWEPESIS